VSCPPNITHSLTHSLTARPPAGRRGCAFVCFCVCFGVLVLQWRKIPIGKKLSIDLHRGYCSRGKISLPFNYGLTSRTNMEWNCHNDTGVSETLPDVLSRTCCDYGPTALSPDDDLVCANFLQVCYRLNGGRSSLNWQRSFGRIRMLVGCTSREKTWNI